MDVEVGAVDLAVAEAVVVGSEEDEVEALEGGEVEAVVVVEDSVAEVVAVAARTDEVVVDSTGIALTEP